MATFIKGKNGNTVANATSYELAEKTAEGSYNTLATKNEINFELEPLNLPVGNHTLVVKAKADGYEDSDYSNEVVYTVDVANAQWEVYSPDGKATVWNDGGLVNITCTSNKAVVAMLKTGKANFSFTTPKASAADGGKMVIIGRYGNNAVLFRPRGSTTGTNLQRYDYTTFGGGVLTTDSSAVNTFAAGDKLSVKWSGNVASLYVNDVLQSSFDCSTWIAEEDWEYCAGWCETNAQQLPITLYNFTLDS